jgi:glycosyltransferase involved in cell wall biosynthesis
MTADSLTAPLRILLVNRALPCHRPGGLERHVEDLALGLAARGHAVHLLAAAVPPPHAARFAAAGVTLHPAPAADPQRYTLGYLRAAGPAIERLLAAHAFDLIHIQEFAAGFWTPRAGMPPVVLTVHGTITSETPLHRDVYPALALRARPAAWLRYGRRFLFAPAWRAALRCAALVCVDSHFTQGELLREQPALREAIRVVPLSVHAETLAYPPHEAARAELGWDPAIPHILTLGRVEWAKGQTTALAALATLRDLPWRWIVPGVGSDLETLRREIAAHGLQDRIGLPGRIEEPLKRAMLAAADLFLWPEQTHPAFGLVAVESMLAGTPVLGTPRGAIPEVIGTHGWIAPSPDAAGLAAALQTILRTPATLKTKRPAQRPAALERFGYERMLKDYEAIYQEVTSW